MPRGGVTATLQGEGDPFEVPFSWTTSEKALDAGLLLIHPDHAQRHSLHDQDLVRILDVRQEI